MHRLHLLASGIALTVATVSCSGGLHNIPLAPGDEPACLAADRYQHEERAITAQLKVRALESEVDFLTEKVRSSHLILQLRHQWSPATIDYRVNISLEVEGSRLAAVPAEIDALAAITGEPPHSETIDNAHGLIIWATGGIAILSEHVTKLPAHVQLYALLGRKPCEAEPGCENLQVMFPRPADESLPARLGIRFDFIVENDEGIRDKACPPHNQLGIVLPPGDGLAARLAAVFGEGPVALQTLRDR